MAKPNVDTDIEFYDWLFNPRANRQQYQYRGDGYECADVITKMEEYQRRIEWNDRMVRERYSRERCRQTINWFVSLFKQPTQIYTILNAYRHLFNH